MKEIQNYKENIFESIKHIDEDGREYWLARELQQVLEYKEWRKFKGIIEKAIDACNISNYNVFYNFVHADKIVKAGATFKKIEDYKLSRYACYLIVQNGDSRKEVIALGQTYFAIQTRKQEILEESYKELSEDEKRLRIRKKVKTGNYGLNQTAVNSGVKDLAKFTNAGYKGLYNGETADDIAKRKELRYREDILDNMGSIELADNLFRMLGYKKWQKFIILIEEAKEACINSNYNILDHFTQVGKMINIAKGAIREIVDYKLSRYACYLIVQTDDKLQRDNVDNEYEANLVHYEVGKEVRNTIKRLGTMPEDLPTPITSLKNIDKNQKIEKGEDKNE